MDDFNISTLHESKNEWSARLVTILTPLLIEGLKSIFDEAVNLCKNNDEMDKYLMTFQNFICRIPKWNPSIIDNEKNRIIERSGCGYLEELITCVHIIQLKLLTAIRVGKKQKKIDINIPKLDVFIHKVYINIARKIYKNVYLFEIGISPLNIQKNNRELEINVQECILNTIRESIPVENILRAYMDETVEEDVVEEIKEEVIEVENNIEEEIEKPHIINEIKSLPSLESIPSHPNQELKDEKSTKSLSFDENVYSSDNTEGNLSNGFSDDEDEIKNDRIKITYEDVKLDNLDIHNIEPSSLNLNDDLLLNEFEVLE